jgi:hypothetical protein
MEILEGLEESGYWMDLYGCDEDLGQYERPESRFYGKWSTGWRVYLLIVYPFLPTTFWLLLKSIACLKSICQYGFHGHPLFLAIGCLSMQ